MRLQPPVALSFTQVAQRERERERERERGTFCDLHSKKQRKPNLIRSEDKNAVKDKFLDSGT